MVYKASSHPKYDSNVVKIQQNLNTLQEKLGRTKWAYLNPDGLYGPTTAQAVKAFQKEYRCAPYDGIYGSDTDMALKWALENAETAYNSVPVASISINKTEGPRPIFPGNSTLPSQEITSPNEMGKYTTFLPAVQKHKVASEKSHRMLNATLAAWAPIQNGLSIGLENMAKNLKKYKNMSTFEKLFYKSKVAGEIKDSVQSAIKQGAKEADSLLIKELKQASSASYERVATIHDYSVPQVKEQMRKQMESIEKSNRSRVKSNTKAAVQIVTDDMNNNTLSESGTLSKIKSKFNFRGVVKAVGHGANILAFHEAIDMFISGPEPDNPTWVEKFKTKIYEGIDSLILGFISALIADLIILGAVAIGLVDAVGAIISFLIGALVGAVLGLVYLIVKDDDTKPFSQWVVDLIPDELIHDVYEVKHEALGNKSIGYAALLDQKKNRF